MIRLPGSNRTTLRFPDPPISTVEPEFRSQRPGDSTMAFMFEKLEVYQKAVSLADTVAELIQEFPRGFGFLADQLNRAALSIATNLAEGNGRFTKPDRKNFFTIARGSVQECVPLLEIARRRGMIDESKHNALKQELETIAKMVSGLINGIEKREI
jgi:four helix bundle protein